MIQRILLIITLLVLGIAGINHIQTLPEYLQLAVTVSVIMIVLVAAIFPKIDFDYKVILMTISGYILFGKGFAYLSPFQPIFIGEICLGISFIMVLGRVLTANLWSQLFASPVHIILWFYLIYGVLHLYVDFPKYGLVSLKDAATVYYALFFLIGYIIFNKPNNLRIFIKYLPFLFILGFVGAFYRTTMSIGGFRFSFAPHKDGLIGFYVGVLIILFLKGIQQKSLKWYILFIVGLLFLLVQLQMSVVLALIAAALAIVIWARKYQLMYLAVLGLMLGGLGVLVISAVSPELFTKIMGEFNSVDFAGGNLRKTTTGWRLAWWTSIWKETMAVNPFFGTGFGSDIVSEFIVSYWGSDSAKLGQSNGAFGAARYPHNIFFTMIGRLGLIGASIFMIYILTVINYLIKFTKLYCRRRLTNESILDIGVVCAIIAGIVNAFVQSTYESPYAAIPHWILLAYMVYKVKNYRALQR